MNISARKTYARPRKERPGANVLFKRIQAASMEQNVNVAVAYAREASSVVGRWLLYGHLTNFEANAARIYAIIMGRFDRYFTEAPRTARSPVYERAYGKDDEIERHMADGTMDHYEASARKARRRYDKLQKLLIPYADGLSGRNFMKDALDAMCCEDIEPPAAYRKDIAAALRHIGHEFGVDVTRKKRGGGRPTKNGRGYRLSRKEKKNG